MPVTVTPAVGNAEGLAYTGAVLNDPDNPSAHDPNRVYAKFVFVKIMNEILALIARVYGASVTTITGTVASPTSAAAGGWYDNVGMGAKSSIVLPTAARGVRVRMTNSTTYGARIVAAAGDNIRNGDQISITAGYLETTQTGESVELVAHDATTWVAEPVCYGWQVQTS